MTQENIEAQERFGAEVSSGDVGAVEQLVAADCVDRDPVLEQGAEPRGFREMFAGLGIAFSDLHLAVEHLTATDDDAPFAYVVTGTHEGR